MKKKFAVLLIFVCVMLNAFVFPSFAYADTVYGWARIVKDSVNLFADENCEKTMFILEKSYYVEILQELDRVYMVEVMQNKAGFPSILGYVRKIEVTPTEVAPISPIYPTEQLYVTADSAPLKLLPTPSAENVIVATTTQKLSYYGKLTHYGKSWYYVCCGGKFGYVEVSNVSKPSISLHPTPLEPSQPVIKPTEPTDKTPTDDEKNNNKAPASEILLIVFVVLLAGGLTLALFLPGNKGKAEVFDTDI